MAVESLKITGGNAAGQTITLEQELVIGRSTPGLGSLGGDSEISRVHARIFHDPSGRLTVEDLGSTNGTFVNGNRITGQQPLNSGDQVRVGQTTLSVEGGAADAGATSVGNVIPAPVPIPPAAPAAAQPPPTQQLPPQQPYGQPPGGPPPPPPGGPGYAGGPIGGPPQAAGSGGGPNRNLLIALAAVLVIAFVVAGLAIGGVFGGDDNKSNTVAQTTPTTTTPTTSTASTTPTTPSVAMPEPPTTNTDTQGGGGGGSNSGGYPPGFAKGFVDSCSSSGKLSHSQCQCWFNKLKSNYTFIELTKVLQQAKSGSIPPKAVNLLRQCIQ
jgi:hypothetical protein